jgi:choline dehydrogenase-like flavoprotein
MSELFDAIIIGPGQARPSLAGRLTDAGMTVALIERKLFGGTCVKQRSRADQNACRQPLRRSCGAARCRFMASCSTRGDRSGGASWPAAGHQNIAIAK